MLFTSKKNQLTGLDIGSRTVKAGEIVESKSGRSLRRFAMAEIPPGGSKTASSRIRWPWPG